MQARHRWRATDARSSRHREVNANHEIPRHPAPLTNKQVLETAAIALISNRGFAPENWKIPPFRAPHHSASPIAPAGGGGNPRSGEVSLAHNGILFLDEFPEFDRKALESLHKPLESGNITISRAGYQVTPGPVPADRYHEPLPVRLPRRFQRPMSLHIGAGPTVPELSVRPTA
jgi:hypothetical protein